MTPVFFIHIPKAGGTSIRNVLQKRARDRLVQVYPGRKGRDYEDLRNRSMPDDAIIFGHFDWGLHEFVGVQPRYAAVLRHPVERLESWYRWMATHPHLPLHDRILAGATLPELVEEGVTRDVSNAMVACIAGRPVRGPDDHETLKLAMRNLEVMEFVSVLERLPRDAGRLFRRLGIDGLPLPHKNRSRVPYALCDAGQGRVIEHNGLDLALYRRAAELAPSSLADQR